MPQHPLPRSRPFPNVLVLAAAWVWAAPALRAQEPAASRPCGRPRAELAVPEVLAINLAVNRFDALVLREPWARTDFESWAHNIRLGWEWDENAFGTNMFSHPFHGSLYFNAGRSNCLSYWESVPLAFLGSWTWEYFGETYRPSLNDFFMTTFGGIALGEISHRVASTIRNTETRGAERLAREIGATLVDPIGGLNRLLRGDWSRTGPNPPEHRPGAFEFRLKAGVRKLYGDSTGIRDLSPTILLDVGYGDPFAQAYRDPFDVFTLHAQVSPGGGGVNALEGRGRLFQLELPWWGSRIRHVLVITHRYDYINNPAYSFGLQSVEVGMASRFPLVKSFELRTRLAGDLAVLGAIDAPFSGVGTRTYDFGPGAGATLEVVLARRGRTYVVLRNRGEYLHSVSGAPANHLVAFSSLEGNIPLAWGLGVGFHFSGYARISRYAGDVEDTREFFETRLFVSWTSVQRPGAGQPR